MTYRITAVCLGNICRSPMAEAVIRARVDDAGLSSRVTVDSAGTDGWHVGEDADPRTLETLRAAGYDLRHSGRKIERAWFDRDHPCYGDLVLAMDAANYRHLLDLAPDDAAAARVRMLRSFDPALADISPDDARLAVPDPYYGGKQDFAEVLAMIEAAAGGLVTQLPTMLPRD